MPAMDELDPKLFAIGGAVVLVALVGLTLFAKKTPADLAPAALSAAPPKPAPPPSPALFGTTPGEAQIMRDGLHVDPSELYPKAKARALAWDRNAELLSLVAQHVTGGAVDFSVDGAAITYTFRIPRRPAPSGQPEPPDQYLVAFTQTGVQATEQRSGSTARMPRMEEPTCPFRDAVKNATASGISELSQVDVRFEFDRDENRGVWRVGDRMMDGKTCAIARKR
jgi:hypothetical protein